MNKNNTHNKLGGLPDNHYEKCQWTKKLASTNLILEVFVDPYTKYKYDYKHNNISINLN